MPAFLISYNIVFYVRVNKNVNDQYYNSLYGKFKRLALDNKNGYSGIGDYHIDTDMEVIMRSFVHLYDDLSNQIEKSKRTIYLNHIQFLFESVIKTKPSSVFIFLKGKEKASVSQVVLHSNSNYKYTFANQNIYNIEIQSSRVAVHSFLNFQNRTMVEIIFETKEVIFNNDNLFLYIQDPRVLRAIVSGTANVYTAKDDLISKVGRVYFDSYQYMCEDLNISKRYLSVIAFCLYKKLFNYIRIDFDKEISFKGCFKLYIDIDQHSDVIHQSSFVLGNLFFGLNLYTATSNSFSFDNGLRKLAIINYNKKDIEQIYLINKLYTINKENNNKFLVSSCFNYGHHSNNYINGVSWYSTYDAKENSHKINLDLHAVNISEFTSQHIFYFESIAINNIQKGINFRGISSPDRNFTCGNLMDMVTPTVKISDINYNHLESILNITTCHDIYGSAFFSIITRFISNIMNIHGLSGINFSFINDIKVKNSANKIISNAAFCSNVLNIDIDVLLRVDIEHEYIIMLTDIIETFVPSNNYYSLRFLLNDKEIFLKNNLKI